MGGISDSTADLTDRIATDDREAHSRHSALRERIVEHLFIGEVLRILWTRDIFDAEILRSEFDAGDDDLVMCRGPIVRHVQLKVSLTDSSIREITASLRLLDKPSGCVLWLLVTKDLKFDSCLWFSSEAGEPLPDIIDVETARHAKGNSQGTKLERNNHRRIPRSDFVKLGTVGEVLDRLFGTLPDPTRRRRDAERAAGAGHCRRRARVGALPRVRCSAIRNPHTRRAYARQ